MKLRKYLPILLILSAILPGCGTQSATGSKLPATGQVQTVSSTAAPSPLPALSATPLLSEPIAATPTPPPSPTSTTRTTIGSGSSTQTKTPTPVPSTSASPAPSATPAPSGPSATEIVNSAFQQYNGLTTYTAVLDTYEVGPSKTQQSIVNGSFRKPSSFRLEVVSGTNAGVTIVSTGGSTAQVKKSIFTLDMSLSDPQLLSPRGDRLDQSGMGAILRQFAESGSQAKFVRTTTLNGRNAHVVELQAPSMRARSVAKALIAFDAAAKYLVLREEYDASGKVTLRMAVKNVQLNPQLPSSTFSL